MNIVLLGPPGAGKGTQAELMADRLELVHLSTGDIFRYNLRRKTELGELAGRYLESGDLVPDEVTIAMVRQRLQETDARRGAIFDGFPRNLAQAEALEAMWPADSKGEPRVVLLNASEETLLERLTGRLVCRRCGFNYHETLSPPGVAGVCDRCGGRLAHRPDDGPETLRHRLEVYRAETEPLIDYYSHKGYLRPVDGQGHIDEVTERVLEALTSTEKV